MLPKDLFLEALLLFRLSHHLGYFTQNIAVTTMLQR